MAPSVWVVVSHPLWRLLKSSHSATAPKRRSLLTGTISPFTTKGRSVRGKRSITQAGNQELTGSSTSSTTRGPGATQEKWRLGPWWEGRGIIRTGRRHRPHWVGGGGVLSYIITRRRKSSSDLCPKSLFSGASGKRALEGAILRPEQHRNP